MSKFPRGIVCSDDVVFCGLYGCYLELLYGLNLG